MSSQLDFKRRAGLAAVAFVVALGFASILKAQTPPPFRKDTLLSAVQSKRFQTDALVEAVQKRGVDFETTDEVASEFRRAGAFPQLIDAMRANYRPSTVAVNNSNNRTNSNNSAGKPPLTQNEVITLLENGVPSAKVQQMVAQRGVDFGVTPQVTRSITQAGGTQALITTIRNNRRNANVAASRPAPPAPRGPTYDDLISKATATGTSGYEAAQLLQAALRLDANRPEAYQLLGYYELYVDKNLPEAEKFMRAAIERGGSAVFRVYHDHASGSFTSYCQGSLYVSKDAVKYDADDGVDSYRANFSEIKEAKVNGLIGSNYGAFHIKVPGSKRGNYNFAPLSKNSVESRLIISFIQTK